MKDRLKIKNIIISVREEVGEIDEIFLIRKAKEFIQEKLWKNIFPLEGLVIPMNKEKCFIDEFDFFVALPYEVCKRNRSFTYNYPFATFEDGTKIKELDITSDIYGTIYVPPQNKEIVLFSYKPRKEINGDFVIPTIANDALLQYIRKIAYRNTLLLGKSIANPTRLRLLQRELEKIERQYSIAQRKLHARMNNFVETYTYEIQ